MPGCSSAAVPRSCLTSRSSWRQDRTFPRSPLQALSRKACGWLPWPGEVLCRGRAALGQTLGAETSVRHDIAVQWRLISLSPAGFFSPHMYLLPVASRVQEHHCPDPAGRGRRALGTPWGPVWRAAGESPRQAVGLQEPLGSWDPSCCSRPCLWVTGRQRCLGCCSRGSGCPRGTLLLLPLDKLWSRDNLLLAGPCLFQALLPVGNSCDLFYHPPPLFPCSQLYLLRPLLPPDKVRPRHEGVAGAHPCVV